MKTELKMGVKSAILAVRTPPPSGLGEKKKRACQNDRDTQLPPNQAVRTYFHRVYNGNFVLAIPQKDSAIGNGNPRPV